MKTLQYVLRSCGGATLLLVIGLLSVSFRTTDSIATPSALQSTNACPTANFTYSRPQSGFSVSFTNLSTQMNTCTWDFGDGTSSTSIHPQHTYATPGTYQVRLTVYSDDCTVSIIGTVDVIIG